MSQRFHFDVDGERLTALVYAAAKPIGATLLLGHGASAGQQERFVVDYATGLAERGVLVVTYDFPFMEHGRRRADPDHVLQAACRAAIIAAGQCRPKNRLFIGGKSLGGRVASEVAAVGGGEADAVAGLVVLGYPLHPLGKPATLRSQHLREVRVPTLFVQGTRDPFGTPEELRRVVAKRPRSEVHVVEGGDHSFVVPRRGLETQGQVDAEIQDEIARWMSEITSGPKAPMRTARPRPIASHLGTQLRSLRRGEVVARAAEAEKGTARRKTRAEKLGARHETKRAGKAASYALEAPSKEGRTSRKSTRSSANRSKSDSNLNLREQRSKGSPENRARKARVRAARVRGAPAA